MADRDLSAFAPAEPVTRFDADGIPIPAHWLPAKWAKLPLSFRLNYNEGRLPEPEPKKARAPRPGATRYTTEYAIAWGRRQGWKLIDRERYDARTKRHHDLMLGVDAMFESPDGLVGVQGAGKSERKPHFQRFEDRGGAERASRLHIRVCYVEFERGNKTPKVVEWWA